MGGRRDIQPPMPTPPAAVSPVQSQPPLDAAHACVCLMELDSTQVKATTGGILLGSWPPSHRSDRCDKKNGRAARPMLFSTRVRFVVDTLFISALATLPKCPCQGRPQGVNLETKLTTSNIASHQSHRCPHAMEIAFPAAGRAPGGGEDGGGPTLTAIEAQRVTAVLQGMVKKLALLGTLTATPTSSSSASRSPAFHVRRRPSNACCLLVPLAGVDA